MITKDNMKDSELRGASSIDLYSNASEEDRRLCDHYFEQMHERGLDNVRSLISKGHLTYFVAQGLDREFLEFTLKIRALNLSIKSAEDNQFLIGSFKKEIRQIIMEFMLRYKKIIFVLSSVEQKGFGPRIAQAEVLAGRQVFLSDLVEGYSTEYARRINTFIKAAEQKAMLEHDLTLHIFSQLNEGLKVKLSVGFLPSFIVKKKSGDKLISRIKQIALDDYKLLIKVDVKTSGLNSLEIRIEIVEAKD